MPETLGKGFFVVVCFVLFEDFIYLFFERGEGREEEQHQCVVASHVAPTGDPACNPGTCPGWESNQQPLVSQAGAQSTKPHQPGLGKGFRGTLKWIDEADNT